VLTEAKRATASAAGISDAQMDAGWVALAQWPSALIGVGRPGRTENEPADPAAGRDQPPGDLSVHFERPVANPSSASLPILAAALKNVRKVRGQRTRVDVCDVADNRFDAYTPKTLLRPRGCYSVPLQTRCGRGPMFERLGTRFVRSHQ